MATATANGTLSPPPLSPAPAPASPSLAKRKRTETNAIVANGVSLPARGKPTSGHAYSLQAALEDFLTVLKSHDTQPSILTHPIASSTTRSSSGEADSKRAKSTPPAATTTITGLIQDGAYSSLQALEKDVESAVAEILASSGDNEVSNAPPSLEDTRLQAKALAFQKTLRNLVEREDARRSQSLQSDADPEVEKQTPKDEGTPIPIKEEEEPETLQNRTVLTLYGTAQVPKQLFSSLQQPQRIPPTDGASNFDTSVKVTLPLRESSLPNFMSTTEVFPLPDQVDSKKTKTTTIGEVFRAPAHLPQISPPKIAKPTIAKGNTITFAPPETPKPKRKGSQSYAHQQLSAGSWLGYGGIDIPKDQTSPTARQKSRQRALSTGEAQQPPPESTLVAVQQAREDALFRSAYSSFAPTRDDASAIIPEVIKNRVWWQKVGETRFNDMFPIDPALLDVGEVAEVETGQVDLDEDFKEAVENFVPVEENPFLEADHRSEAEKNTDEILQEISELLQTLASHQRIRNSSLTTNPRTPVVQNASLASLAGSPLTPSSEEIDVYSMLKSQLTVMVSMLPPYAVAKLNGDQLEELNISRTILFDTKEYRGVLEEDQLSRLAKAPAPVVAPATLTRTGSGTHPHYAAGGAQYARPTPSAHASTARPVQATPLHYPQQQSLHRSSSMHVQRSPSGPAQGYQAGATSYASSSRPGFPASSSYNQQTPRPSYGQTASGQYYPQRSAQPSNYGGPVSSQYQATPQSQSQNRYAPQQSQNGYYPRSQNVAPMYNTTQTPQARNASPMKTGAAPLQSNYGTRPAGYGTPVSGGQLRSTYYGPSQYGTTPQVPVSSAYNPQQMMIDRQQAQVAAQSQARLAAQNSFNSRQGSRTPQPPNASYGGQVNGASMST